ncbi:hypothetical protein [Mongoliitalea daihaiensis]|uniref:hypothetical protein n=1 Tax=Mongoliitalea daihaiensis TaxID=2782006 RepID=UPI001F191211|nr:hypothetical protein [Mongoliitalea daihaiensis]UJP64262.1 hypothetical protein IPZ59_15830 [Mongoliitalea daihaiensis]
MKKLKKKWMIYAVGGILLLGFGFSLMGESLSWKISDEGFWEWFGLGTLALAIIMAGLSVFGQAIVFKTRIDLKKESAKKKKR